MGTIRQQMMAALKQGPHDLRDLSQALHISEKEVKHHLPHVAKSISARNGRFTVTPANCEGCDYTFADRRRLTPPGKCPRCKQSRIHGPWYQITS